MKSHSKKIREILQIQLNVCIDKIEIVIEDCKITCKKVESSPENV